MEPFIIARHGARLSMKHTLNQNGKKQVEVLGDSIKTLFPDYESNVHLYYDGNQYYSEVNKKSAEIIGDMIGVKPMKEEIFAANPKSQIPRDKLEALVSLFEQQSKPVIYITSNTVITQLAPFIAQKHKIDIKSSGIWDVGCGVGYEFDFEKKDIIFVPMRYSMIHSKFSDS